MATVILGNQNTSVKADSSLFNNQIWVKLLPALTENLTLISGHVYGSRALWETYNGRMGIWEHGPADPPLVAQSAILDSGGSIDPQWSEFAFPNVTLESGKRYIIGIMHHPASYSEILVPRYGDGSSNEGIYVGGNWPDFAPTLGPISQEYTTRNSSMYITCSTQELNPSISNVNGNNIIISKGSININGSALINIQTVTISDYNLDIDFDSSTDTKLVCVPFDIHNTSLNYGTHSLVLYGTDGSDSINVTLESEAHLQRVTVNGLIANGIFKDVPGATDGDVAEIQRSFGNSTITLYADGDVKFSPAVTNDSTMTRYRYDGSAWDSGPITIYQGTFSAPVWTGTPSPPAAIVGRSYSYNFGVFVQGDRPMVFSIGNGALPAGLSIDQASESIVGVPTQSGTFPDISIVADNTDIAGTIKVSGD